MSKVSRREAIQQAGALASLMAFCPTLTIAAKRDPSYATEIPDMLPSYLAKKLNALAAKWERERAAITTPQQLEARNRYVREKAIEMIHGLPDRTPLNPVVVASHERKGYRVENVMFEGRPNFWVTGNLYVPTTGKGPFPGIISPCGHYPRSRMEPEYQYAYINMVQNGFVVLAYDPIGQGERRQYWNPVTDKTEIPPASTNEHSMPGQVYLMLGEDLTQYFVWEGMRAIDYLLTRPEVDKEKIGCAGHSGGGTLTRFIAMIDQRVKCAVINQGGMGHRWPIRGRGRLGPSDIEQNLFPAALNGVDSCDMVVSFAPRPMLGTIENYGGDFDVAAGHIKARYALLGAPEKFATEEATDPHSWTVKLRLATTDWFSRWFYGKPGPKREPDYQAEEMKTLYCTPNGSIRYSQKGETIFTLLAKKGETITPKRKVPESASELAAFRRELTGQIRKLIKCDKAESPLGVRHIATTPRKGYNVEKVQFLSEPGVYIPTWVFVPESSNNKPATLFVSEAGKEEEGKEFEALEKLTREGNLVIAVDIRGIGETSPGGGAPSDKTGPFAHLFDAETGMSYMAWYMDESLFGMRVRDVMRSVDYAFSRADIGNAGLRVVGKGQGALWSMYAAAFEPRISSVIAQNGLVTYKALTQVDRYLHGANVFIRDVLKYYDLPQVAALLAGRDLTLVSPVDPMKEPVSPAEAQKAYEWTAQVYRNAGAAGRFRIVEKIDL